MRPEDIQSVLIESSLSLYKTFSLLPRSRVGCYLTAKIVVTDYDKNICEILPFILEDEGYIAYKARTLRKVKNLLKLQEEDRAFNEEKTVTFNETRTKFHRHMWIQIAKK